MKKSKELEKKDDLERDNRKEEDMRKIEMEFEHKKVQEEVIKPFPKNKEDNKDTLQQKPHIIQKDERWNFWE